MKTHLKDPAFWAFLILFILIIACVIGAVLATAANHAAIPSGVQP